MPAEGDTAYRSKANLALIDRNRCEGPTSRREGEESEALRLNTGWARDG